MGFFKKKEKAESIIETATAEEALSLDEYGVTTSLVFHPSQNYSVSQTYVLKYHHEQLPSLKPNQISISGIRLTKSEEQILIEAFIRNTLEQPVSFPTLDLIILDKNGSSLGRKSFDVSAMGNIPARSSIPWKFEFEKDVLLIENISNDDWTLAFELKQPIKEHTLDLAPSWREQLPAQQIDRLDSIVKSLPKLGENEVNFIGVTAKFQEDHSLAITLFVRNGNVQPIIIEQIPLVVEDATGEKVCQGSFLVENFEVDANATKPWTFIFPAELVEKKSPDFSRWKVYIPSND